MGAAEVKELRALASEINLHVVLERDVREARVGVDEQTVSRSPRHVLARVLGRDHLDVHLLHLYVAASVIRVVMRVDDVPDRLGGHRLQHREDVVVIDRKLIVDQHNALGGDQSRRVARDEFVVDDIQAPQF